MNKLEKIAFYIVLAVAFLLPIIFISPQVLPVDMLKSSIFSIGTSLALLCILISAIQSGKLTYVNGKPIYALFAVVVSFILSGLAVIQTSGFNKTFFGTGLETNTILFSLLGLAFVYTVVTVIKTKERFITLLSTIVLGGLIVALFHLIRIIFGPGALSFGLFNNQITNTVGQWNDLGVYFGFLLLISYFAIEFMSLSKIVRIILYVLSGVSLLFLIIGGFSSVWYGIAIVTLFAGLYSKKYTKLSYRSIVLFVLSIVFIIFGTKISAPLSTKLNINFLDVHPSWELSIDLANQALQKNPFFGAGPNKYENIYLQNKPQSINETIFWSIDFTSGVSYISSFVVLLGIVGSLAILWLIIVIVLYLFKAYKHNPGDHIQRFSIISSAGLTLYSLILGILYNPSLSIIVLGLTSLGLFIVTLKEEKILAAVIWEGNTPRKTLIIKIISSIIAIIVVIFFVFFVRRMIAGIYFQKAVTVLNTKNDITLAENYAQKAADMVDREMYYQGLAEISIIKINQFLSNLKQVDQPSVDTLKSYLSMGIENAQKAIKLDPLDYQNYITQARVYQSVVPARVSLAYENAMKSYESAAALNPLNPSIYLLAAQLEVAMKKLPEAKQFIGRSLQVKNNYSDAIFLLAQIQVSENSIKDAISSLLYLAQITPQDPAIFFQLGLLYYSEGDNVNTGLALSKAVELNPQYSNARYFLGLALARLGKYPEAAAQFAEIQKYNPENTEVAGILESLKAGRSPFQTIKSPEKAKNPPVRDAIDKKTSSKVKTR